MFRVNRDEDMAVQRNGVLPQPGDCRVLPTWFDQVDRWFDEVRRDSNAETGANAGSEAGQEQVSVTLRPSPSFQAAVSRDLWPALKIAITRFCISPANTIHGATRRIATQSSGPSGTVPNIAWKTGW